MSDVLKDDGNLEGVRSDLPADDLSVGAIRRADGDDPGFAWSSELRRAAGVTAFICGAAVLIARGCVGYTRGAGATWGIDFERLHWAGQHWLSGTNPYIDPTLGYAYPPHASLPTVLYGMLPFEQSRLINFILSVASLLGIFALYMRWFPSARAHGSAWPSAVQWTAFAYVMASNATTSSLFFGGIAIPVFFCTAAACYFVYEKDKPWVAGLFLAGATLKPQFSFFLCLLLLLEGRWRTLLSGGFTALNMSLPSMFQLGFMGSFQAWFDAIRDYTTRAENWPGDGGVMTFDSVLASVGYPHMSVKYLAFVGFILVFLYRRSFARTHLLTFLPFLSIAFLSSHDGDYVSLSLMWVCLIESASADAKRAAILGLIIALLFVPFGVMQATGSAFLLHWRLLAQTSALIAYLLWIFIPARFRGTAVS